MARTGRPKAQIQRDDRVIVRLTQEEHAMIREYAHTRKCTITQLMLDGIRVLKEQDNRNAEEVLEDRKMQEDDIYSKYQNLSDTLETIQDILSQIPLKSEKSASEE